MAKTSLVPRPSPAPVFDRLHTYRKGLGTKLIFTRALRPCRKVGSRTSARNLGRECKRSKTGAGEGLGTRLAKTQSEVCLLGRLVRVVLLALWSPATYVRECTSYGKLDTTRAHDDIIFITEAEGNKKWCPHVLLDVHQQYSRYHNLITCGINESC